MCRVASKKLLNKALYICREHAGSLLQAARLVQSMELTDKNDFGDSWHMASTEPFFYDSAYKLVKKNPDFLHLSATTNFSYSCVHLIHIYACKGVFNPNIPIFASNSAEGLHFSAFHYNLIYRAIADLPTVPYFPGQNRKYKPCPGVPNVCLKIPDIDGPGYGVKYLCA